MCPRALSRIICIVEDRLHRANIQERSLQVWIGRSKPACSRVRWIAIDGELGTMNSHDGLPMGALQPGEHEKQ
jgi:hypothetical protein